MYKLNIETESASTLAKIANFLESLNENMPGSPEKKTDTKPTKKKTDEKPDTKVVPIETPEKKDDPKPDEKPPVKEEDINNRRAALRQLVKPWNDGGDANKEVTRTLLAKFGAANITTLDVTKFDEFEKSFREASASK